MFKQDHYNDINTLSIVSDLDTIKILSARRVQLPFNPSLTGNCASVFPLHSSMRYRLISCHLEKLCLMAVTMYIPSPVEES